MSQLIPMVSLGAQDTTISPNPYEVMPLQANPIDCAVGVAKETSVLPAASSNVSLPFPIGLTVSKVLAIFAVSTTDLVVKYQGVPLPPVPMGQALFLYGAAYADVNVSTVKGGKIVYVVGG